MKMNQLFLKSLIGLVLIVSFNALPRAVAATTDTYVTEDIGIVMRSGPTNKYRVIGRVTAGDKVTVLATDTENKRTQITDSNGTSGWVASEYIVNTTSDKALLQTALNANQQLQQQLDNAKQQVSDKEGIIVLNDQLQQQVSQLENEVSTLSQQADLQKSRFRSDMFYAGAITVLISMLISWFLTRLVFMKQQRSGWR